MTKNSTEDKAPENTTEETNKAAQMDAKTEEVKAAPEPEVPTMADLQGVRYTGTADVKRLTASDLQSMGAVDPKGDLEWSVKNNHFIAASEVNASTRDVLAGQPDFIVE